MVHVNSVSKKQLAGHARRAQHRLQRAFSGSTREDLLIRSAAGAVGVAVGLKLIRLAPVAALLSSVAPMAVFAAIFSRGSGSRR